MQPKLTKVAGPLTVFTGSTGAEIDYPLGVFPGGSMVRALTEQRQGRKFLAPLFTNLGDLEIGCLPSVDGDERVDEHFVFCGARLHLYYTHVEHNADGSTRLDAIWHGSAGEDYEPSLVAAAIDEVFAANQGGAPPHSTRHSATASLLEFNTEFAPAIDVSAQFFGGATSNFDSGLGVDVTVQINDPTVYFVSQSDGTELAVMLYYSDARGGLCVATREEGCCLGTCSIQL